MCCLLVTEGRRFQNDSSLRRERYREVERERDGRGESERFCEGEREMAEERDRWRDFDREFPEKIVATGRGIEREGKTRGRGLPLSPFLTRMWPSHYLFNLIFLEEG